MKTEFGWIRVNQYFQVKNPLFNKYSLCACMHAMSSLVSTQNEIYPRTMVARLLNQKRLLLPERMIAIV